MQKGYFQMFPIDNKMPNNIVWNENWINPYESAWNIGEKLYSANVSNDIYNSVLNTSKGGSRFNYIYKNVIYSLGPLSSEFLDSYTQYSSELISILENPTLFILKELRYCPCCAKDGYHSILHQIIFFKQCYIHNTQDLINLCNCKNNYCIFRKKYDIEPPFACKRCGKQIPFPSVIEGINNKWNNNNLKNKILNKSIHYNKNVNKIFTIDIFHSIKYYEEQKSNFTNKQLLVLRMIYNNEKIVNLPKPILSEDINNKHNQLLFLSYEIQMYLKNNYSRYICEKQYDLIYRHYNEESFKKYIKEIVAAYYLMGELLGIANIDRIYPVNFFRLQEEYDSGYNIFLNSINSNFLTKSLINNSIQHVYYNCIKYRTYNITNYIYKSYVTIRYKEILDRLKNSTVEDYPLNAYQIKHNIQNYQNYLIILLDDGKLLLY